MNMKRKYEMSKFKVGDKVYCLLNGWGEVESINSVRYPVTVKFGETITEDYKMDGLLFQENKNPCLFTLDEAKAKGYEVPKQKVKKTRTGWVNVFKEDNDKLFYDHVFATKEEADSTYSCWLRLDCVQVTYEYEEEET